MEKEKIVQENKKKNIIIIILSAIIICLLIFLIFDKVINKDNKENKEPVNKQEETNNNEINQEETNNDEKNQEETNETANDINKNIDTLKTKSTNLIHNYNFQNLLPFTDISQVNNQFFLEYALNQLEWKEEFTKEEVELVIKNTFGNEVKLNHENIKCDICSSVPIYKYNSKTQKYTYNIEHDGHGGNNRYVYEKYIDGSNDGNIYTLNYKITYSNPTGDEGIPYKYYKNTQDANNNTNVIFELQAIDENGETAPLLNDETFKIFEDKLPITTFTYEKNADGTFNLKSVTIK